MVLITFNMDFYTLDHHAFRTQLCYDLKKSLNARGCYVHSIKAGSVIAKTEIPGKCTTTLICGGNPCSKLDKEKSKDE